MQEFTFSIPEGMDGNLQLILRRIVTSQRKPFIPFNEETRTISITFDNEFEKNKFINEVYEKFPNFNFD